MSRDEKTLPRRSALKALALAPLAAAAVPSLVGCGGGESEGGGGGSTGPSGNSESFTLTVGDAIGYDVNELRCGAGDEVTVTVNHTGSMSAEAMGHNFVLLAAGVDVAAFATAAIGATDTGYIPADRESDVIAHTNIVGGGASDSVTFQAPAAGTYKYICTFPGHYMNMQGDFIVS